MNIEDMSKESLENYYRRKYCEDINSTNNLRWDKDTEGNTTLLNNKSEILTIFNTDSENKIKNEIEPFGDYLVGVITDSNYEFGIIGHLLYLKRVEDKQKYFPKIPSRVIGNGFDC